jgi:hypothetical protein
MCKLVVIGILGILLLSHCDKAGDRIALYDPGSLKEIGYKDKAKKVYRFNSGTEIKAADIKPDSSGGKDLPLSKEQATAYIKKIRDKEEKNIPITLDPGAAQATERANCECWLMHEGGVGCSGCACKNGFVYEHCWDIQ